MAHSPKADHPVGLSQDNFSPPVPIDPPGKAGHATEYTFRGPPTPQLEREKKEVELEPEHSHEGVQKGDLTPPGASSKDTKKDKDGDGGETTFEAPKLGEVKPSVIIEFCDRCRWAPRATWIQTELFLTFPNPLLRSITLLPLNAPETGGRFRVWLDFGKGKGDELVWDRKTEGGFPELKVLKQRIRNIIQPDLNLGHSDAHGKQDKPKEQETGLAN
ncbi:hypothetical protein I302_104720 [Kwoniella bestiolae CBS 10118]|uniref:Selenoprotein W n=1 Tax=Kwoniella bestiolae CBS 10118 TaxID=1296100 RepID=A0A1B9FRY6_9TREE|nr:selenoprotein W [Kwoniella bestiolae CBS 10118]OCF21530.1 selenoprotein W [Kwoniella bestiolae CBS 10118]